MPRLLAALLAAALSLAACAPVDILNDTISRHDLTIAHAAYRPGPRGGLDVYRPADHPTPLPLVVFFYGGSWEFGRRQDYLFVAAELARRGVVVVVPDYRVYPEVQFPGFLQDAAKATAFAYRHAAEWGADPHRVFVVGHSAGAWLAAMLALDPHWLAAAGLDRNRLAGTVGISGPYDFLPIVRPDIQRVFATADADLRATQPIDFVDGHNRPMLLLHGLADTTVEPRNTTALDARIAAAGGLVRMRLYPGIGHIGTVTAFAPLFRSGPLANGAPVLDDVARFVTDPALTAPLSPRSPGPPP